MHRQQIIQPSQSIRPTHVVIDLNNLAQNYRAIERAMAPKKIMPILKANAYGHGLLEVASFLQDFRPAYFGVAYLEEGIFLRDSGISTPILVLGGIIGDQIPAFIEHDLTITASSVDKLIQINEAAKKKGKTALVHLKIDTGMERIGIHYFSAFTLLEASLQCDHCAITGIFTHFARADENDLSFTLLQLERFKKVLKFYDERHLARPLTHCGNSGAILQIKDQLLDLVRPGLLLYGIYPGTEVPKSIQLSPCLTWKTKIVYFKVIQAGSPVSYGGSWVTNKMTRLITLPVGYGDGYFRSMSNKAQVIIHGKKYPVVGNICMDQMMVDLGWDEAYNGEEVLLVGASQDAEIRIEDLAAWAGTIPYEVLTNINTRVPRKYVEG